MWKRELKLDLEFSMSKTFYLKRKENVYVCNSWAR